MNEIKNYYDKIFKEKSDNIEGVFNDIPNDFKLLVRKSDCMKNALDLGYGYGNYSIFLAENNFCVDAFDIIDTKWFKERIQNNSFLGSRINIRQMAIEDVYLDHTYDFVIAKDVLHYLNQNALKNLLIRISNSMNSNGTCYFVVFTDIIRRDHSGVEKSIENEAHLKYHEWVNMLNEVFPNFKIELKTERYAESERYNNLNVNYFEANRVISVIRKS